MGKPTKGDKPLILLIGNIDREGVLSTISQSGRWYIRKVLHSQPANWHSIIEIISHSNVSAVLVLLTPQTYDYIVHEDYASVSALLFRHLAEVPHTVFVHEDLYHGIRDDQNSHEFEYPTEAECKAVAALLNKNNVNVVTYQKNSEVTLQAVEFLGYVETGLMLRLYVPNAQLWANETNRILDLFRDYLTRIAKMDVRLDETRTKSGIIYELRGDPTGSVDLSKKFSDFSEILRLCTTDPAHAESLLQGKLLNQTDITHILSRYAKEARRLQLDMRQEFEQKILRIRHQLESEVTDSIQADVDDATICALVERTIPSTLIAYSPLRLSLASKSSVAGNLTVNINPQIIQAVHGVVAQEISGDINLNENDSELLRLFEEYGAQRQADLVSALRELKDESAPKPGRLTARQKIGKFLEGVASKGTEFGIDILKEYLKKQLFGS